MSPAPSVSPEASAAATATRSPEEDGDMLLFRARQRSTGTDRLVAHFGPRDARNGCGRTSNETCDASAAAVATSRATAPRAAEPGRAAPGGEPQASIQNAAAHRLYEANQISDRVLDPGERAVARGPAEGRRSRVPRR